MKTNKMKWQRIEAGLYRAQADNGDVFEVERIDKEDTDNGKAIWHCRCNGTTFDAADTKREAQGYCQR